jgi:hypothetical protein
VVTALLVTLFFRFERSLGASGWSAFLAAMALGVGTYIYGLSGYFLRHPTEALLGLGSLWGLHAWLANAAPRRRDLAIAAGCASGLILVRVPAAIFGVGFGVAVVAAVLAKAR